MLKKLEELVELQKNLGKVKSNLEKDLVDTLNSLDQKYLLKLCREDKGKIIIQNLAFDLDLDYYYDYDEGDKGDDFNVTIEWLVIKNKNGKAFDLEFSLKELNEFLEHPEDFEWENNKEEDEVEEEPEMRKLRPLEIELLQIFKPSEDFSNVEIESAKFRYGWDESEYKDKYFPILRDLVSRYPDLLTTDYYRIICQEYDEEFHILSDYLIDKAKRLFKVISGETNYHNISELISNNFSNVDIYEDEFGGFDGLDQFEIENWGLECFQRGQIKYENDEQFLKEFREMFKDFID